LARDAAVVAEETGKRGRELLNGGDIFGGGAMIFARSDGLFSLLEAMSFPRLPGLLIWIGDRGLLLGLAGFRFPDGEGIDLDCELSGLRRGSCETKAGCAFEDTAAESEVIR